MIALACDHGAFDLKELIKNHLESRGFACKDFGCYDKSSCDYSDFAAPAAQAVASGECDRGIVEQHNVPPVSFSRMEQMMPLLQRPPAPRDPMPHP